MNMLKQSKTPVQKVGVSKDQLITSVTPDLFGTPKPLKDIKLRPIPKEKLLINLNKIFQLPRISTQNLNSTFSPQFDTAQLTSEIFADSMKEFIEGRLSQMREKAKRNNQWKSPFVSTQTTKPKPVIDV